MEHQPLILEVTLFEPGEELGVGLPAVLFQFLVLGEDSVDLVAEEAFLLLEALLGGVFGELF